MGIPSSLLSPNVVTAGNNAPLHIDDPDRAFVVSSGQADLFCVRVLDGGTYGHRDFVATARMGDLLFGLPARSGYAFLAIGNDETRLREVLVDELYAGLGADDLLQQVEGALRGWIERLGNVSARRYKAAKINDYARPGAVTVVPGRRLVSPRELLWVDCGTNDLLLYNGSPIPSLGCPYFPLTGEIWISSAEPREVPVLSTREVIAKTDFRGLRKGVDAVFAGLLIEEHVQGEERENERIGARFSLDDRSIARNLVSMGSFLERHKTAGPSEAEQGGPLLACCHKTGEVMGIDFQLPARQADDEPVQLWDIARASHVRYREVALEGGWWRQDNGPMVGYWSVDGSDGTLQRGAPVALLPKGTRSYTLYDPADESTKKIDAELADRLFVNAHMFYRSLPERALGALDLFRFVKKAVRLDGLTVILAGFAAAIVGLLIPEMQRVLFDRVIPEAATNQMLDISLILVAGVLATGAFEMAKAVAATRIETKADSSLQTAVWDRLLKLPVVFFRDFTAGDLAERSLAINGIRRIVSGTVASTLMGFLFSLVNVFLIYRYSGELANAAMLATLVNVLIALGIGYLQIERQKDQVRLQGEISGLLLQLISGVAKLQVSASERRAFGVWAGKFGAQKRAAYRAGVLSNLHTTITTFYPIAVSMILYALYMKALHSRESAVTIGTFLAFITAYTSFKRALISMTLAAISSLAAFTLYERATPILTAVPEVTEAKAHPGHLSGDVEVNHVRFRYHQDGPLVLKDVSLRVRPGEFVAIVGGSGSGKSTLLRLLLGFETPESGSIYYDGQDLEGLDVVEVRRQTGVVLQNGSVMSGSIRENILGSSNLTVDDAWEAARMVGFEEDIKAMPMGMFTALPPGGGTLSGGQRQRLIIARAVVRHPSILFLDEATSALDNRTQAVVSKSLENLNVTRVVIAHRLSTIVNADRIYVLKDGELVEQGDYQELMAKDGFFAELARRQIA